MSSNFSSGELASLAGIVCWCVYHMISCVIRYLYLVVIIVAQDDAEEGDGGKRVEEDNENA